jgi:Uri superfamily endonuclease
MINLPAEPGSYALELFLPAPAELQIGRMGRFSFPAGAYLYLGSASGPGGLRARLGRHLLPPEARPVRWHIDALRLAAAPRALGYLIHARSAPLAKPIECLWSQALSRQPGSAIPAPGFGARDCRCGCPAHLVAFPSAGAAHSPLLAERSLQELLTRIAAPICSWSAESLVCQGLSPEVKW